MIRKQRKQSLQTIMMPLLAYLSCFNQLSYFYASASQSSVVHRHRHRRHNHLIDNKRETTGKTVFNSCYLCNGTNEIPYPEMIAFPAMLPDEIDKKCSDLALEAVFVEGSSQLCLHYQFIGYTRCRCEAQAPTAFPSSSLSPTLAPVPEITGTTTTAASSSMSGDEGVARTESNNISFWLGVPIGFAIGAVIVFVIMLIKRRRSTSSVTEKEIVMPKKKKERDQKYDMIFVDQEGVDICPIADVEMSRIESNLTNFSVDSIDTLFRMEEAFPVALNDT